MCSNRSGVLPQSNGRRNRREDARPDLRVGTAERSEVADVLSQHYAEGRLDNLEFNERTEHAMTAKTRADLTTLLTDLPGHAPSAAAPTRPRRRPRPGSVAVLVILAVLAFWAASLPHAFWLLGVVIVWVAWRRHGGRSGHSRNSLGSGSG
jgi:Domain of unknown function (DUF1707)